MTAPQGAAADASSILIVDDMEENLVALEAVLGSLARVVRAHSGEAALKAMLRQEFAVALIDVLMPGMNGFETAANIKGLDQTKDIPIILLTGAAVDPNYAYRGYTVGAADFLIKPFDPWLLRTKVNVFLELHRKNRQLAEQAEQLTRLLAVDVPTKPAEEQHRLVEVEHQLAQVQSLLREREGTDALDAADLADRIAVLERAVGRLVESRDQ
ncbi:response regulator [Streptomyces sp. NBC_00056]|uniref:response regulator n=1 Tax=unclassified Streptomyces TaxID=2593676 RepID=UPI0022549B4A|nr:MULTISPECIES: response regulator [unclassified Streptomyces]MCX5442442.1 response regulator [Streptomyces sp. NBC_00063]WUB91355.1 response regulator [Streptomyces sp. NBC_00569]